jgi:predicted RNase H-like HicB family nuclease
MEYTVIIEHEGSSCGAYVPDLPGCVAVGDSVEDVRTLITEGIALHIAAMREDGQPIPTPSTIAVMVRAAL